VHAAGGQAQKTNTAVCCFFVEHGRPTRVLLLAVALVLMPTRCFPCTSYGRNTAADSGDGLFCGHAVLLGTRRHIHRLHRRRRWNPSRSRRCLAAAQTREGAGRLCRRRRASSVGRGTKGERRPLRLIAGAVDVVDVVADGHKGERGD